MPFASSNVPVGKLPGVLDTLRRAYGAWLTIAASLLISLIGVYCIHLSDAARPLAPAGIGPTASRQLLFLGVGVLAALIAVVPNYRALSFISFPLLGLMIALLIFLLVPFVPSWLVAPRNGARSWINIGPVDFQPSEVAKIGFVLALSHYLRFRENHRRFLGLVPPGIIAFIPIALITLQPDFGTALLFVPVLFAMLVAAGAKLKHLAIIVIIAATASPVAYPLLKPHQKARIVGLIQQFKGDTSADQDINMQSVAAQRLIGAGGFVGQPAERATTLMRFNPLPERHNDMIPAVIIQRFGLLGAIGLLFLYFAWIVGALITAGLTREPFGRLICVGFAAFVAAQVFVNLGMNTGLLPIIGITLPYASAGGSSLVAMWLMTGLVLNVAVRRPKKPTRHSFEFPDE